MKQTFRCTTCKIVKPTFSTGANGSCPEYGQDSSGRKHCWACCGARDARAMARTGRATLYLTGQPGARKITNWPGTLSFPANVSVGSHNMTRTRYDAWFTGPDGRPWHGVRYGEYTQICHCRRVRSGP